MKTFAQLREETKKKTTKKKVVGNVQNKPKAAGALGTSYTRGVSCGTMNKLRGGRCASGPRDDNDRW